MTDLKWYERLIITGVVTLIAFIICAFIKSNMWISVSAGSLFYGIFDHTICYFRFHRKRRHF